MGQPTLKVRCRIFRPDLPFTEDPSSDLWVFESVVDFKSKPGELKYLMYPEERTSTETPLVVTSERGPGQWSTQVNWNALERAAIVGDSPVQVKQELILE